MNTVNQNSCLICESKNLKDFIKLKDHSHTGEFFGVVQCCECGFNFTQDAPDKESIGPYYKSENYISHSDIQKGFFFKIYHSVRNYMLKKKRNLVCSQTKLNSGKLLDIGTGTGYFPNAMIEAGWKAEGIEQDEKTRSYATSKFGFKVYDTSEFQKLPSEGYDAVTMWHVLEHVHDVDGYLEKIFSILNPNGILIVAVPNHKSFDQNHYKEFWAAWDIPIHLWHFNPYTMKRLLEKHGFKVEKKIAMPFDAIYVSMLSEQYKSGSKIPGLLKGIVFALRGKINPDKCSSIIYVVKKS